MKESKYTVGEISVETTFTSSVYPNLLTTFNFNQFYDLCKIYNNSKNFEKSYNTDKNEQIYTNTSFISTEN